VNTDFAQVEADDQQVNLSRFSLFFPERRLFFQERGGVFEYGLGGNERLFYTRRIGLAGSVPVRIYGGVRAVARAGEWDIGFIDMQTAGAGPGPGSNDAVLRARRRVLNDNSYLGGIVTSRIGTDGSNSQTVGGDLLLRVLTEDFLTLNVAGTRADGQAPVALDRSLLRAVWERPGIYGVTYTLEAARVGSEFNPTLGFVARDGYTRGAAKLAWGWRAPAASRLLRTAVSVDAGAFRRHSDVGVETVQLRPEAAAHLKAGGSLRLNGNFVSDELLREFRIATGVRVPPGQYDFGELSLNYGAPDSRPLRIGGNVSAGTFYDGTRVSGALNPSWTASPRLQLSGTYQLNRVDFETRAQRFTSHLFRARVQTMLDSRLSATWLAQYSSASDAVLLNVRIRYNPREGDDLYIVYNHGLNTDRFSFMPERPFTDNRTLLIKYARTFALRL
jgi:hypothetical protein